jgi:large subunit ribosomal protein L24
MGNLNIRKNDTVVVLSGRDKGKRGRVMAAYPKEHKVLVEGVNLMFHHLKPRSQTDPGGIRRQEIPIYSCKVMRVCPACKKPTRTAHAIQPDGSKVRVCKHCGDEID